MSFGGNKTPGSPAKAVTPKKVSTGSKYEPPRMTDDRQSNRFSFGLSGLGETLGFGGGNGGGGRAGNVEAAIKKKSSRAKAAAPAESSSVFSFLDPFGFFVGGQVPPQAPAAGSPSSGHRSQPKAKRTSYGGIDEEKHNAEAEAELGSKRAARLKEKRDARAKDMGTEKKKEDGSTRGAFGVFGISLW